MGDNLEKGVFVSDVFLNQTRDTSKQLELSIKKKILGEKNYYERLRKNIISLEQA